MPIPPSAGERGIARLFFRAAQVISALGVAALVALAFLVVADVLMRWLFAAPIDGVGELMKLTAAVVVASFFPAALADRQHIAVELVGDALGRRAKGALEALGALVTLVFFAVVAWRIVLHAAELRRSGETTWILGWPVAPWWAVVTLFIVICIPVQIVVLARLLRRPGSGADTA